MAGEGYEEFECNKFWGDAWIKSLMLAGKFAHVLLFEWAWMGPMRTPSGLFQCPIDAVRHLANFKKLTPKRFRTMVEEATAQPISGLAWFPDRDYWWVKNYIGYRSDSPNKLVASAKDLLRKPPELASLVIGYNLSRGVDLTEVEIIASACRANGFPVSEETLREGFAIATETYIKPSGVSVSVPVAVTEPENTGVAKAPPGWMECLQAYADGYRSLTDEKVAIGIVDTARLKATLKEHAKEGEDGWQKVRAVIAYAVSGKDDAWGESVPLLQTIVSHYHLNRIKTLLARRAKR